MDLFWLRGYEATSVQELLDVMGIGRGSLYDTFGDKHALFLVALDRYREAAEASTISILEGAESPKEAIGKVFEDTVNGLAAQEEPRRGCLLVNSAVELAPHDPAVKERISRYVARVEDEFEQTIVRGQTSGELKAHHDPKALARFLVSNVLGLRVLARAGADRATLADAAQLAMKIID